MEKPHILGLTREAFGLHLEALGWPKFRANQVWQWMYERKVWDPSAMHTLPQKLKDTLLAEFDFSFPKVLSRMESNDGSTKLLLETTHVRKSPMESVILRYDDRVSLCVSSQVGCKMACGFCQTGKLGFLRHLGAHEILQQFVLADTIVRQEGRRLSHVVFMGMGEPLDNFESVVTAVSKMIDGTHGFGLSRRHVTLSTSGLVPEIKKLAQRVPCRLAVSLHAADDRLRTSLMPINRKYPLAELKEALREYQKVTGDKVTIEYLLIKGVNDSKSHAKELVSYLQGLRVKVNLIPFNPHPGLPFERPDKDSIEAFQKHLADRSIPAPVRYSKGLDVSGACGQLAAKVYGSLEAEPQRKNILMNLASDVAPSVL